MRSLVILVGSKHPQMIYSVTILPLNDQDCLQVNPYVLSLQSDSDSTQLELKESSVCKTWEGSSEFRFKLIPTDISDTSSSLVLSDSDGVITGTANGFPSSIIDIGVTSSLSWKSTMIKKHHKTNHEQNGLSLQTPYVLEQTSSSLSLLSL